MSERVYDDLKAMIGQDQPEMVAVDEVCKQMIRHWCEAMEDANPLYSDEEYARSTAYGSIVAPPTMVQAWVIPPLWPRRPMPPVYTGIFEVCARGGLDQILDTDCEMEFFRPLYPGDRVKAVTTVCDVTREKQTRLGNGHFVTLESTYLNQKGELICVQHVTILMYRRLEVDIRSVNSSRSSEPGESTDERLPQPRMLESSTFGDTDSAIYSAAGETEYRALHWEDVAEGDELPTLTREITTTTVIAAAIASRDFYPVHHDSAFARRAGARDVFFNILTSSGSVGKYVTDWSGPEGELRWLKFRLGVPCCAGDCLTMTGSVARKYADAGRHLVDVGYCFAVQDGNHCTGMATITLPVRSSA